MSDTAAVDIRPTPLDHLRSRKKAPILKLPLCLDLELSDAYDLARLALDDARAVLEPLVPAADEIGGSEWAAADDAVTAAEVAVETARVDVENATQVFVFQAVGRKRYEKLLLAHPPTDEQKAEAAAKGNKDLDNDPDNFPQALIAACLVDPQLSEDDVHALWDDDDWTASELGALYDYSIAVNRRSRVMDLGKGSSKTQG